MSGAAGCVFELRLTATKKPRYHYDQSAAACRINGGAESRPKIRPRSARNDHNAAAVINHTKLLIPLGAALSIVRVTQITSEL